MRASISAALYICFIFLCACSSDNKPTRSLEVATKGIHGAALSNDGKQSAIGSILHGGSFWRVDSEERVFNWNHKEGETTTITVADFSDRGDWVLTANPFNLVLWDTKSGKGERFWQAPGEILDAELGPNANFAILGLSDHTAVIFNIRRGGVLRTFQHNNRVRSVDLSQDGKLAITGSEDYTANLWDIESGEKISSIKHNDDVQLVKISPDGSIALSMSKYDKALLWNTRSGEVFGELPLGAQRLKRGIRFISARFSRDNALLITGRPDRAVELWDIATLSKISRWTLPKRGSWKPTSAAVIDVSFGEDNDTFFAIASNGYIHTLKSRQGL